MRGFRVAVLVLSVVSGCSSSPSVRAVLEAPDIPDGERAGQLDPDIAATGRACDEQHDARACARAAESWEGANGHPFDPAKSFHYASSGCDGGDELACALLGVYYEVAVGVARSPQRAAELYRRSCDGEIGLGCAGLGASYSLGDGVELDRAKARAYRARAHKLWLHACLGGELRWCTYAAASTGDGEPTAVDLYRRACDGGVASGCIRALEHQLAHAAGPTEATMGELDRWCSRGQSAACAALASAYDSPEGPRDPGRAAAALRRACGLGDGHACLRSGVLHELAAGVPKDDSVARQYFRRACDRRSAVGCLYLAQDMLVIGGDVAEAERLAQRGCELHGREACDMLIWLSRVRHHVAGVLRWGTVACRMGSSTGCQQLLAHGAALPKGVRDAVGMYRVACEAGVAPACERLPQLVQAQANVVRDVAAAAASEDVVAFGKLVSDDVEVHHLLFRDPACAQQFSAAVRLTSAQHPALLRCLARAGVRVVPAADRGSVPFLGYDPEVTLTVQIDDGVVQWIGASAPPSAASNGRAAPDASANPYEVEPTALNAYRITGEAYITPDLDTKRAIAALGSPKLSGSFKLCVTARGAIASVTMLKSTGSIAYDRIIERKIYAWRYHPFTLDGEPAPVCTAVTFVYTQHGGPPKG